MSSWASWFTGTRDTKKPAREAIIRLRQNLQLLERKEQHLQTQIDEQQSKARANAVSNPDGNRWRYPVTQPQRSKGCILSRFVNSC